MKKLIFLICFLFFFVDAECQIYVDNFKVGNDLLLDSFPNAGAAYSLRKLRKDYEGPCVTLRKTNGSLASFGFFSDYLDTAQVKSWCGSLNTDTCWVVNWFDQSLAKRTVSQTTNSNQPRILTSGTLEKRGNFVSIRFDGVDDYMQRTLGFSISAPVTTFSLNTYSVLSSTYLYDLGNDDFIHGLFFSGGNYFFRLYNGVTLSTIAASVNTRYVTYALFNSTSSQIRINNNTLVSGDSGTRIGGEAITIGAIFQLIGSTFLNGHFQEFVTYYSNVSTNQNAIMSNINNFYSIY